MQAAVHRSTMVILVAEILAGRALLVPGDMDGVLDQLVHAVVVRRRNRHDGDAQQTFHLVDTDGSAVAAHLVHHVQRQHHRHIQLHQLDGQVQVALDVAGIDDVDQAPGPFVQDELARDHFLGRAGR